LSMNLGATLPEDGTPALSMNLGAIIQDTR
jgi:hypothetical protein